MAVLIPDLESYPLTVKKESRAILLAGEPIKEKVSSYGPFVMNTQTEIMEAPTGLPDGQDGYPDRGLGWFSQDRLYYSCTNGA